MAFFTTTWATTHDLTQEIKIGTRFSKNRRKDSEKSGIAKKSAQGSRKNSAQGLRKNPYAVFEETAKLRPWAPAMIAVFIPTT